MGTIQPLDNSDDPIARLEALLPLRDVHVLTGSHVEVLINGLHDSNRFVRRFAATVLGRCDQFATSVVPALVEHLGDKDLEVKRNVIRSLGTLGPLAKESIAPLAIEVSSYRSPCGAEAAIALGKIGLAATAALVECIEKRNADAALAFRYMPAEAIHHLRRARWGNEVLIEAFAALGQAATPDLVAFLNGNDFTNGRAAARALAGVGASDEVLTALSSRMRQAAARYGSGQTNESHEWQFFLDILQTLEILGECSTPYLISDFGALNQHSVPVQLEMEKAFSQ